MPLLLLLVRIWHTYFPPVVIRQLIFVITLLQLSHMGFPKDVSNQIYSNVTQGGLKIPFMGSGHSFPNVAEFRDAIYLMSIVGRFRYRFKRNSTKHMTEIGRASCRERV